MILFLDTTTDTYILALATREGKILRIKKIVRDERIGDKLFTAITGFLKSKKPEAIMVVIGPGRFSGIRHGVSIANTLCFAWDVSVIGIKKGESDTMEAMFANAANQLSKRNGFSALVLPAYGMEPTITLPR